jgi:hypothetical protein
MNPVAKHLEMREERKAAHNPEEKSYGLMCTKHFGQGNATWDEVDNCIDCAQADMKDFLFTQNHHTIDPNVLYGQHIPLTCRNHPNLSWHTKNIGPIGSRHIFYGTPDEPECECPVSALIPILKEAK